MSHEGEIRFEFLRIGSEVPDERRDELLEGIARVIELSWRSTQRHWSRASSPFHEDFGLVFAWRGKTLVAYSLYRRLDLNGIPVLYRAGAAVDPAFHQRGLYTRISRLMLDREREGGSGSEPRLLAWRTRNPLVWEINASWCEAVVPSIAGGPECRRLREAMVPLAGRLFPGSAIDTATGLMRDVYPHLTYLREPLASLESPIARWFSRVAPSPADAVFSIGRLSGGSEPDPRHPKPRRETASVLVGEEGDEAGAARL